MKPNTPEGFSVCGWMSAVFCVWTAALQLTLSPVSGESGGRLAVRGLSMLLVPLSAVVTEALWRVRPWVYRASLSLALVSAATLAAAMVTIRDTAMLRSMVLWAIGGAVAVVLMLRHIHTRSRQMWPRARVAAPAARP